MGASESIPNPSPPDADGVVTTKFDVGMTCEGCAGAVKKVLGKLEGVKDVSTNVDKKTVVVKAAKEVTADAMLESLQKWGTAANKSVALAKNL